MFRLFFILSLSLVVMSGNSQTVIGTTSHPEATANHNQRKIVRDSLDNVYVIYSDSVGAGCGIFGVVYDRNSDQWSAPLEMLAGKNPTIAISKIGRIFLVFESQTDTSAIYYSASDDFSAWSQPQRLSDSGTCAVLPVADVDSLGNLNVFWIEHETANSDKLKYCRMQSDTVQLFSTILERDTIRDVAVANNLSYVGIELFYALEFNNDSILFFRSSDKMQTTELVYAAKGHSPCITFNQIFGEMPDAGSSVRLLYIDNTGDLTEVDASSPLFDDVHSATSPIGSVDEICIDNMAPPIGFSFLYQKNNKFYHGFSYGIYFNWISALDSIESNPIHPTIAYKHFNFYYVDYVWMEDNGSGYNVFHKRDAKHVWVGTEDHEVGKGFSITGSPNPFSDILTIRVQTDKPESIPEVKVFDSASRLVKILAPEMLAAGDYSFQWNGENLNGNKVSTGVYVIICTNAENRTARKVVFAGAD